MVGKKPKETATKFKAKTVSAENPSNFKSTEFIADSDDADDAPAPSSQKKTVTFDVPSTRKTSSSKPGSSRQGVPKVVIPQSEKKEPQLNSQAESASSESDGEKEEAAASSNGNTADEDTTSTDGTPIEDRPKAAALHVTPAEVTTKNSYNVKPVNGLKRKAEGQLARDKKSQHKKQASGEGSDDKAESSEGRDDEVESESGSGEDDSENSSIGNELAIAQATKENEAAQTTPKQRRISSYKPPAGFEKAQIPQSSSSKTADMFKPSNLEGKQIWHITAPSQLPIASVEEVSATSLKDGSSILSYEGSDYGLVPQTEKLEQTLLLPFPKENWYQSLRTPMSRVLHIRQLVRLPSHVSQPNATADAASEPSVPRHQQPTGLKMRFRPFGLSSDSDSDGAPSKKRSRMAPHVRHPPDVEQPSAPKKQKQKTKSPEEPAEHSSAKTKEPKPAKKSKFIVNGSGEKIMDAPATTQKYPEGLARPEHSKSKKPSLTPEAASTERSNTQSDTAPPKAQSPKRSSDPKHIKSNGVHPASETPKSKETLEQRAKRKEKKRRQKALQQQSSSAVNETPSSVHKSSKRKSATADMPLAEYSARLSSAEDAKATSITKHKSNPVVEPRQSRPSKGKESSVEKMKRKEAKKKKREAQSAADSSNTQ